MKYNNINTPQMNHLYLELRYSKYSPSSVPILIFLDNEPNPRARFYPIDQGSWDRFVLTQPIDLGKIGSGIHSIKFYTDGQQYGVADLDTFVLSELAQPPTSTARSMSILVDDFSPQPYQGEATYLFNRFDGERGAIGDSIMDWGTGQVTTTVASENSLAGVWMSLNHPIREGLPINFSALLPPQILPAYQSQITGITVQIARGTANSSKAVDNQISYYPTHDPTSCFTQLGLFGLSAAEVPSPSMAPQQSIYQAFGVGGQFGSANDGSGSFGAPVVAPHYSALIASLHPQEAIRRWDWLINNGHFSPLNNVESFMFPASSSCDSSTVAWNQLKGSWNLALQTLGWGRLFSRKKWASSHFVASDNSESIFTERVFPPGITWANADPNTNLDSYSTAIALCKENVNILMGVP